MSEPSSDTSATTLARTAAPTGRAPDIFATGIELDGMRGSVVEIETPDGSARLRLPLPGLYNVYNALGALATALRMGVPLETAIAGLEAVEAAFGRVETVEVAGKPVSILLIKNPAGANEVLRTLALEAGDEPVDLWLALNDGIADGRDVSWIWDADFELLAGRVRRVTCAGTRAPEMAVRLKYAGFEPDAIEIERLDRGCARPRRRRSARAALRTPHVYGPDRVADTAGGPRTRPGVLAVSLPAHEPAGVIWHDAECGGYVADQPLWAEVAAMRSGPVLELGCGTGRVALALAAAGHEVVGVDNDPDLVAAMNARAAVQLSSARGVVGDACAAEPGGNFAAILAPMQMIQLLADEDERSLLLQAAHSRLGAGGLLALAIVEGEPKRRATRPTPGPHCRTSPSSTAGSTQACHSAPIRKAEGW